MGQLFLSVFVNSPDKIYLIITAFLKNVLLMKEILLSYLEKHTIQFREIKLAGGPFPPPDEFWIFNHITRCKNLFFRDNHGKNHFLVVFDYYRQLDIKKISAIVGRGSLSFASGWRLEKYLGLTPGYLSVFGIMNDKEQHVQVVIDKDLRSGQELSFLPNTPGGSFICLPYTELVRFVETRGNKILEEDLG